MASTKNAEIEVKGDKLTVAVDLSKSFGESSSGKSLQVATANGPLGGGCKINMNAYIKLGKKFDPKGLANLKPPEMKNVVWAVEGTVLTMTVDITATGYESSSGKTFIIGSTSGNRQVGTTGVFVGLNVTCKTEKVELSKIMSSPITARKDDTYGYITLDEWDTDKNAKTVSSSKGNVRFLDTDITVTFNVMCKDKKIQFPESKAWAPVNEKAQNLEFQTGKGKDEVQLRFKLSGDFGDSSSGVSTLVSTTRGPIGDSNLTMTLTAYRKKEGAKSAKKDVKDTKDTKDAKGTTPTSKQVYTAVKKFMEKMKEGTTKGEIRKAVLKAAKWEDGEAIRKLIKQAIDKVLEEDSEGSESEAEQDEEGANKREREEEEEEGDDTPKKSKKD